MRVNGLRSTVARFFTLALLSLGMPAWSEAQRDQAWNRLVQQFATTKIFWKQFEVAQELVMRADAGVLLALEPWLSNEDRHLRCNAAFVIAGLGDDRGLQVISAVLEDISDRPEGHGIPMGNWTLRAQILADRYYAVHVLGVLKDKRRLAVSETIS